MPKITILYCKRVKDHSCIACAKCFKGIVGKNAEFARHDDIELVFMTDCGDCPGLVVPRVKLLNEVTKNLERPLETCIDYYDSRSHNTRLTCRHFDISPQTSYR